MTELQRLRAELAAIRAENAKLRGTIDSEGTFDRCIGEPEADLTAKYGTPYTLVKFVDANGEAVGRVKGDAKAEEALKALKAVRWGDLQRGRFHYKPELGGWTGQTAHVPSFVAMPKVKRSRKS